MAIRILVTDRGLEKLKRGHPWITADDIRNRDTLPNRTSLIWFSNNAWLFSPKSFIRLRRLGPPNSYAAKKMQAWTGRAEIPLLEPPPKDVINDAGMAFGVYENWFRQALAIRFREKASRLKSDELCFRWIFSENDFIPGLIIDVFQTTLVCQINTAPIDWMWLQLRDCVLDVFKDELSVLSEEFGAKSKASKTQVVELRNTPHRKLEGLSVIAPEPASEEILRWNGFRWKFHPGGQQKTGAYLDQADNHRKTAEIAKSLGLKTAWDICSFEGGFTLHLLAQGLKVTAVDQSEVALKRLIENAELNSLNSQNLIATKADAFEFLRTKADGEKVDLIVLDPPSFVKNPKVIKPAMKGYLDLHVEAFKHLNPDGVLVTCSCSHAVSESAFREVVAKAAEITGRKFELLEARGPSFDHEPDPNFPEGRYLQALFLRCVN